MAVHKRLRMLRLENDWTQEEMAKKLSIDKSTYNYKENGITEFKLGEAKKISDIFKLPIEKIFFKK